MSLSVAKANCGFVDSKGLTVSGSVSCVSCDPTENWLAFDSTKDISESKLSLRDAVMVLVDLESLRVRCEACGTGRKVLTWTDLNDCCNRVLQGAFRGLSSSVGSEERFLGAEFGWVICTLSNILMKQRLVASLLLSSSDVQEKASCSLPTGDGGLDGFDKAANTSTSPLASPLTAVSTLAWGNPSVVGLVLYPNSWRRLKSSACPSHPWEGKNSSDDGCSPGALSL